MKTMTTLWYVNLIYVFAGLLIIGHVIVRRERFHEYLKGIKAVFLGVACLGLAPLIARTEGGGFSSHELTSLYSMNAPTQFGASRMVGIGYIAALYGVLVLLAVAANKHGTSTTRA